ncbi:LysR family transcriptional regulator [Chromobacterium haemolyticum]|uniref:LysR family transcriptional regulator n=1 Tax=Chromobacterium haemolyticum TaxID=394935 RepID=A0A1W0CPP8_9NEIS|nr:LysR family transcriptional regulator [Chromobacterium haemolyticum]MBK0414034.1 LysR family transcriptional regulator [Chromobacterium haemolyticum]MBO0415279.1 LysR family transcriptional regulator [Chromobacterium haemolyticum]MBO0498540.1 LysR family transcriptional regulator [Chromobacterium haemolyticum]OQS36562.1 LysR family transcriptional regulator [Chromobacterium haemolyticum]
MNKLEAMQIFVRVAELSSFTQAADSLGLPKASISVAVKQTEAWLGARLLHRTTRKVQMTQDGQAFYERCKDVLAEMDELQGMFQRGEEALSGRLRVDMPSGVARYQVLPRLDEFLQRHPRLELELSSTDRKVDIVREGFDCVLRVGELSDSSLVARPLGRFRQLNCASPAYLARHGTPAGLEDLARHRLVHYVSTLGARPAGWEWRDDSGSHWLAMSGSVIVNNADAYQAACLAGLGLIQAPESGVRHLLDRGELVEVLPEFRAAPMPVTLLYAHRRNLPRRARVFMDWLAEALAPHLL